MHPHLDANLTTPHLRRNLSCLVALSALHASLLLYAHIQPFVATCAPLTSPPENILLPTPHFIFAIRPMRPESCLDDVSFFVHRNCAWLCGDDPDSDGGRGSAFPRPSAVAVRLPT